MQRAWIVLIAACWKAGGDAAGNAVVAPVNAGPPRAALDGRLQVAAAPYCGGAAMPPDYQPPPLRPAAGVTLRLVQGDKYSDAGPVIELTTAPDGTFMAPTPSGRWCIARARGPKPTTAPDMDTDLACLVKNWETCDAVVDVPVETPVMVDIHEPCTWTVCYHGSPPP